MNPSHRALLLALLAMPIFAGCQNTMFIGEQHAVDLTVEAKSDASEPAKFNFGYESHSAVVVPPKQPIPLHKLAWPKSVAKGDLLSSFSTFQIKNTAAETGSGKLAGLTLRSGVATGKAAIAIANQIKGGSETTKPEGARLRLKALSPPLPTATRQDAPGIFSSMQDITQGE